MSRALSRKEAHGVINLSIYLNSIIRNKRDMHGSKIKAPQTSTIDEHNEHVRHYAEFQRKILRLRI